MEKLTEYVNWIHIVSGAGIIIYVFYLLAVYKLWKAKDKLKSAIQKQQELKVKITKINRTLLETGMNSGQIMDFWEDCMAEAAIQNALPPCSCKDVNECETWCRAKARFTLNPPIE